MFAGRFFLATSLCSITSVACASDVELFVTPADIPIAVEMTLDIPVFGSSTGSDSTSAFIASSNFVIEPDGGSITIKQHQLIAQDAQITLEFFCGGIFGCLETLQVTISSLKIDLANEYTVPLNGTQWTIDDALYNLDITYEYVGNLVGNGSSQTFASDTATITGELLEDGAVFTIDNLDLAPVEVAVTPDSLPSGVNSINIKVDANISSLVYQGVGGLPADLDGDGQVCGSDLTILLAQWGGDGTADLDGDGLVGGTDIATLLAAWDC